MVNTVLWLLGTIVRVLITIPIKLLLFIGVSDGAIYDTWVCILRGIINLRMELKVIGLENIPDKGPRLIVFNHVDMLDAVIMLFAIPYRMYGWIAAEHANIPVVVPFLVLGRGITIQRGKKDRKAMSRAIEVLEKGNILTVSPEGTRRLKMDNARYGPAYLAGMANAVCIPVGIRGSEHGLKKFFRLGPKIQVNVCVGMTFKISGYQELIELSLSGEGVKDSWQRISNEQIMPRIAELLPPEMKRE